MIGLVRKVKICEKWHNVINTFQGVCDAWHVGAISNAAVWFWRHSPHGQYADDRCACQTGYITFLPQFEKILANLLYTNSTTAMALQAYVMNVLKCDNTLHSMYYSHNSPINVWKCKCTHSFIQLQFCHQKTPRPNCRIFLQFSARQYLLELG